MLIEVRAGEETVSAALPLIAEAVAETAVEPSALAWATPLLVTLTIWSDSLNHETEFVKSCELPSV